MMRQYELVDRVKSYDPDCDEALINRAYVFSVTAHGAQKKLPDDPYLSHAIETAAILTDFRVDDEAIATALLHSVIEEEVVTSGEIRRVFGEAIAHLVDGVAKLSKLDARNRAKQREDQGTLNSLRAVPEDIRVLLVKLADRLHNLRALHLIRDQDERHLAARDAMDIYAPLAERIGMYEVMKEMQTLAFRELEPEAFESVATRVDNLKIEEEGRFPRIASDLTNLLGRYGIDAEVRARERHSYSIWRKMSERHMALAELSDMLAFQVSVQNEEECYRALGLIQRRWPMVPGRFKDYISTPKRNGYSALHTSIIHLDNLRVEIQICTLEMRSQADVGIAVQWGKKAKVRPDLQFNWKRDLAEILDYNETREGPSERDGVAINRNRIFAFTPAGEMVPLPQGATPIDFAYAVHSKLGHQTESAKIDGRVVPLRTVLRQGDKVEILRSSKQEPQESWLDMVVTPKARAAILRHLRKTGEPGLASMDELMENPEHYITPRAAENILRHAASPQIIPKGNKIDTTNGAYEGADGVPLEWLPNHLRDCATALRASIAKNAPDQLLAPLEVYAKAIEENPRSPIVQTLVFCASMIKVAMADPDFTIWANGLENSFEAFLANHQRLVDHFPELETRLAALAELPVDYTADIRSGLSEFITLSKKVLQLLVESQLATTRAGQILEQQLTLARSITGSNFRVEGNEPPEGADDKWTPMHDQAVNNLGVWIQVRDNLSQSLGGISHPDVEEALPRLVVAISRFIDTFIRLTQE
jgi:hypothetical protein